jgi:LPS-assembly protein
MRGTAWFLTPRLALRHTQYQLKDVVGDDRPYRSQEVASLDGGLFFEREVEIAGRPLQQTLEPRLYYLHVPYDDQSNLPVFDTSDLDFTFSQLFRDNRFSGADRMGDAEQLTLALSSRLNRPDNGRELARASLGQIFYFRDRQVTLPSQPIETDDSSSLVGELALQPRDGLSLSATAQRNLHQDVSERIGARLSYRPEPSRALSLSYSYRRDQSVRQTDLVALWPLSQHWQFLGRWHYDLETERSVDVLSGLEYQSCCWGLRLVGRAQLNTSTQEIDRSIYLSLELKGLGNIGQGLDSELERGILGYD